MQFGVAAMFVLFRKCGRRQAISEFVRQDEKRLETTRKEIKEHCKTFAEPQGGLAVDVRVHGEIYVTAFVLVERMV